MIGNVILPNGAGGGNVYDGFTTTTLYELTYGHGAVNHEFNIGFRPKYLFMVVYTNRYAYLKWDESMGTNYLRSESLNDTMNSYAMGESSSNTATIKEILNTGFVLSTNPSSSSIQYQMVKFVAIG